MVTATDQTPEEQRLGLEVVKEELFATYRQTVTVAEQKDIPDAIAYIRSKMSDGGATGKLYVNMSQGGTNSIVTEEVARIPIGGEVESQINPLFGK